MCYGGATYLAELFDDGSLQWDDGDMWFRRDSITCRKNDLLAPDQNLIHKDLKFDGAWGPAYLEKGTLTWNEGEQIELQVLSDTQFHMVYVGEAYSAEFRGDGKLHWSDGDEWSRRCIPHAADLPAHAVLPPDLERRPENGQCTRPVASCQVAPSAGRTVVGKVPKHSSSLRDTSRSPQLEVTPRGEGGIICDQQSTMPRVSGTRSYAALVASYQASSNNMSHHSSRQGKVDSVDSHHAAPVATSSMSNAGRSTGHREVVSKPTDKKRYTGRVSWFRGSYGWVDCAEITTKYNGAQAFLHINDCDVKLRQGDEVEFCLALDYRGNPKAVSANKVEAATVKQVKNVEPINARDWFSLKQRR